MKEDVGIKNKIFRKVVFYREAAAEWDKGRATGGFQKFNETLMLGNTEGRRGRGATEKDMAGRHHWLNGQEFEQIPGDTEGQGSLVCCSPWGCKESDMSQQLNNNKTTFYFFISVAGYMLSCCSLYLTHIFKTVFPIYLTKQVFKTDWARTQIIFAQMQLWLISHLYINALLEVLSLISFPELFSVLMSIAWRKGKHQKTHSKQWVEAVFPEKPWDTGAPWQHRAGVLIYPNLAQRLCGPPRRQVLPRGPSTGNQGLISLRLRGKNFQKREKSNYYISMQIKIHRLVAGSQPYYFRSARPSAWPVNCRKIQANRFFCN